MSMHVELCSSNATFKLRWILSFDVLKKKMGLIFFLLNLNYLNPNARINDILVNTFFFFLLYGTKEVLFVYISCGITLVNFIYIYIYILNSIVGTANLNSIVGTANLWIRPLAIPTSINNYIKKKKKFSVKSWECGKFLII